MKDYEYEGRIAYLQGVDINSVPYERRTNMNKITLWERGWLKLRDTKCNGLELGDGLYSGCIQTYGDCPVCGK